MHGHSGGRSDKMGSAFFGFEAERSVPMSATAFRMRVVISFPVTWTNLPGLSGVGLVADWKSEHTGVFLVETGKFLIDH